MSTPILSKQFFAKHSPDAGFFSKWRDSASWSEQCLPVYEWQGILFVGCLAVPATFPNLQEEVVFVLCDPESLKSLWYDFQGTVVAAVSPSRKPHLPEVPEGLGGHHAPSIDDDISVNIDDNQSEAVSENSPSETSEEAHEIDAQSLEKSLLDFTSTNTTPTYAGEKVPALSPLIRTEPSTVSVPPVVTPPPPSVTTAHATTSPKMALEGTGKIRATPLSSEVLVNKTIPSVTPVDMEITRISVQALQSPSKPTLDAFIDRLFSEMGSHFQKSMLFLKEGTLMKPWRWDKNFNPSTPNIEGVPLGAPSPWRIVMKTHKSYHGYVTTNEISTKFFAAWNGSQEPEHLTLTPILVEDHVIGMLLGMGPKLADPKASLLLVEKLTLDISKQIQSKPEFFKAA